MMIIIEDNLKYVGKWWFSMKVLIIVFDYSNFFFFLFSVCLCILLWFNLFFDLVKEYFILDICKCIKIIKIWGNGIWECLYFLWINFFCKFLGERKIYYNMEILWI